MASNPLTSHVIMNPEVTYVQPSPMGVSVDAPKDLSSMAYKDSERSAIL